jgi:hypothetical protein
VAGALLWLKINPEEQFNIASAIGAPEDGIIPKKED